MPFPIPSTLPSIAVKAIDRLARRLRQGRLAAYPTETSCALGCAASSASGIEAILKIKRRPAGKRLPLLAGSLEQAAAICDLSAAPPGLLEAFWPGPLTVLLPAARPASSALLDGLGRLAIRVSPSPIASALALACGEAISCSSANFSGSPAPRRIKDLDPAFREALREAGEEDAILDLESGPSLGEASTIIEPLPSPGGKWRLRVLREGAISKEALMAKNFMIM